jgi:hypothetical protein
MPPAAAPNKKHAVIFAIHGPTSASVPPGNMLNNPGRATTGNSPISNPSKSHPKNAAIKTIHWPRFKALESGAGAVDDMPAILPNPRPPASILATAVAYPRPLWQRFIRAFPSKAGIIENPIEKARRPAYLESG